MKNNGVICKKILRMVIDTKLKSSFPNNPLRYDEYVKRTSIGKRRPSKCLDIQGNTCVARFNLKFQVCRLPC